jgi:hypothetical protein
MSEPFNSLLRRKCVEKDRRIAELEAENKRLREALEFYARRSGWTGNGILIPIAHADGGAIARAALEEEA